MTKKSYPEPLGVIMESFLSNRGYLTVCREYEVVQKWSEIVGKKLAENTECTRAENGVLYVRVPSAPWRQEISYLKQEIMDKIGKNTNCKSIKDIVFY